MKRALDPGWFLNRGSYFRLGFRGPLGGLGRLGFRPAVRFLGALFGGTLVLPFTWFLRLGFSLWPGPARGRGATARQAPPASDGTFAIRAASRRAITCVNCGECNSVCPIHHHSGIRLPQILTHLSERMVGGGGPTTTTSVLLDLCLRCGNCEEVCQAGIPHLPMYENMQALSDRAIAPQSERRAGILELLRNSQRYNQEFLKLRPGGYEQRTPASLPGVIRYVVQRAETGDGPAATCIHCGACVPVCPTEANLAYREADPRLITSDHVRCIGCGTCVEVCPANLANGGQTLRVFEAPTPEWLESSREILSRLGADLGSVPITVASAEGADRR